MLVELKGRVKARSLIIDALVMAFDGFIAQKPCSLVRIAIERALFVET